MGLSQKLTDINKVAKEVLCVSEYLDISRLPDMFEFAGFDTLPVINDKGVVTGIVSEFDLAKVVKNLSVSNNSYQANINVGQIMTKNVWCEEQGTNVFELFDQIDKMHIRVIPIVDEQGVYTGQCITRTFLINYLTRKIKPRTIAGMATPLGVYLTDGIHQAGAKDWGLIASGVVFATFIFILQFVLLGFENSFFALLAELSIFLSVFRLSPLSKIHASEHMVINAIEKGLPLSVKTVQMQSRVHKRCGTNLIVFLLGILLIFYFINTIVPKIWIVRFVISFFLFMGLLNYWKEVGYKLQEFFTTATPSEEQIENAIKAGKELLKLHKDDPSAKQPDFFSRLYTSGIIQIALSFILFTNIFQAIFSRLW